MQVCTICSEFSSGKSHILFMQFACVKCRFDLSERNGDAAQRCVSIHRHIYTDELICERQITSMRLCGATNTKICSCTHWQPSTAHHLHAAAIIAGFSGDRRIGCGCQVRTRNVEKSNVTARSTMFTKRQFVLSQRRPSDASVQPEITIRAHSCVSFRLLRK